ncbi:MAG: FAD-binding protein, partial [Kiritimatiellaceae bacterium]|nr:FAD-binding protein [Kiritimatiellaceae bacterium]
RYVYTVEVEVGEMVNVERMVKENKGMHIRQVEENIPVPLSLSPALQSKRIAVVGAGPAGMFAAHALAVNGAQVTMLDRGEDVSGRLKKVQQLFNEAVLDGESNISFGEGGAGTFSDGKLTTRKNHPWIRHILDFLVDCGAPKEIATAGKPHIGTDRLRAVVVTLRKRMIELGVDVRFSAKVTGLIIENQTVTGLQIEGQEDLTSLDAVVWATGHSARDSFKMLYKSGVELEAKPFAVGVRIEHPQALVNQWLHGDAPKSRLGAADYRVVCNISEDRSVYSFCMCPGGQIVCSSSHPGFHVVNGMSNYARNSAFANAGLVVKVNEKDFPDQTPLGGVLFQEEIERKAYEQSGGYLGPAQRVTDFLSRRKSANLPASSYEPGLIPVNLHTILPKTICDHLVQALYEFDARYPGFAGPEALMVGTETRTSSPIRIPRTTSGQSTNLAHFFPCGEGAGYAGGIISAALDGLFITQCIRNYFEEKESPSLSSNACKTSTKASPPKETDFLY